MICVTHQTYEQCSLYNGSPVSHSRTTYRSMSILHYSNLCKNGSLISGLDVDRTFLCYRSIAQEVSYIELLVEYSIILPPITSLWINHKHCVS